MAYNVLIIPDKFKGTLTAPEAAEAMARGWRQKRPQDQLVLLPMSDGGDGFGEAMSRLFHAEKRRVRAVDAAHRPIQAEWWWDAAHHTAIIESARVVGLALLPAGRFHPFDLDTHGLAAVFRAAIRHGARRCLVGIGGSATNDGGFGLARALGWVFINARNERLTQWTDLHSMTHILAPRNRLGFREVVVAVDVRNPLLGKQGATRIYGPQKGLIPADFPVAERCLRRLALIVKKDLRLACAQESGTGAAGGLGFGLRAFTGARLEPGFALFAQKARLVQRLRAADLVITGEGAIDASTMMGKGVGEVTQLCRRLKIACLGLAGITDHSPVLKRGFSQVHCLAPELTDTHQAKLRPAYWLTQLAARISATLD